MRFTQRAQKPIAVVGAGIFGLVAALKLDELGFPVDVYERHGDILMGASGSNQLRSHRGYHYPRSPETIASCKRTTPHFEEKFADAVVRDARRYYAIAKEGSLMSGDVYKSILDTFGLPYTHAQPDFLSPESVEATFRVEEHVIDIERLKKIFLGRLHKSKIRLLLNTPATDEIAHKYSLCVVAGYAGINDFFVQHPQYRKTYQFELCEKPIVRLPKKFKGVSLVVMDGPFFCLDPFGTTEFHLLGNVEHAIHVRETGSHFAHPPTFDDLLHKGVIERPHTSNYEHFINAAKDFVPDIAEAQYQGSFFTVRSVLPFRDDTDERPTIVHRCNDRIVTIFSGKIGACIDAAEEIAKIALEKDDAISVQLSQKSEQPAYREGHLRGTSTSRS